MTAFSQVTVPMAAWVGSGRIVTVPTPRANSGAHFGAHGAVPTCLEWVGQGSRSIALLTASTIAGRSRSTVLRTTAGSTRR